MKKARFVLLAFVVTVVMLPILCGCSAATGQPSALASDSAATSQPLAQEEMEGLVRELTPSADLWWEEYRGLPELEQQEIAEWLAWFRDQSEIDREMLSYRPQGFGVLHEVDADELMSAQEECVLQAVEDNCENPRRWWEELCCLPKYDPKSSRMALLEWIDSFGHASESEQAATSYRPFGLLDASRESRYEELSAKMETVSPQVVQAVEEHVYDPEAWWYRHFFLTSSDSSALNNQDEVMDWLVWYAALPARSQEMADLRTRFFFAAWE